MPPRETDAGSSLLGKFVVLLFILACAAGAWYFFAPGATPAAPSGGGAATAPTSGPAQVRIGVAFGSEKRAWFEWAVQEFAKSPTGAGIAVELLPMGSIESGQAIAGGDRRITAWSPGSSAQREAFTADWQVRQGGADPISGGDPLALSPMVFLMWKERHDAFVSTYRAVSWKTISQALREPTGWAGIAKRPEWGVFKFGHTHPLRSNSGQSAVLVMASEYHGLGRGLGMPQILDPGFQDWLAATEGAISGMPDKTDTMIREMILKGPSAYDGVFVYENLAIDYLQGAAGRWGQLQVAYPEQNLWSDHPYYVLTAPWVSSEQRQASAAFGAFLRAEPAQRQSLVHGFRPGDPRIPVLGPDSPFTKAAANGLRNDVPVVIQSPTDEVVRNLMAIWQRRLPGR